MQKSLSAKFSQGGLIAATMAWGFSFILVKEAIEILGVWPFLTARYSLAFLSIALFFPRKFLRPEKGVVRSSFTLGFLLFLATWTQTQGLIYTSVGHSGFVTSLYVPLTPLMGWLIFRKKVSLRDLGVVLLATLGLYFLTISARGSGPSLGENARRLSFMGDLWTLGTAVAYALHILWADKITRKTADSIALGIWQFFWCALFIDGAFLILVLAGRVSFDRAAFDLTRWPVIVFVSITFNALVTTDFAFIMQLICQKTVSSVKAALIFALEAPFACLFAYWFKGDLLTTRELFGAAVVLIAGLWPESLKKKEGVHGAF